MSSVFFPKKYRILNMWICKYGPFDWYFWKKKLMLVFVLLSYEPKQLKNKLFCLYLSYKFIFFDHSIVHALYIIIAMFSFFAFVKEQLTSFFIQRVKKKDIFDFISERNTQKKKKRERKWSKYHLLILFFYYFFWSNWTSFQKWVIYSTTWPKCENTRYTFNVPSTKWFRSNLTCKLVTMKRVFFFRIMVFNWLTNK